MAVIVSSRTLPPPEIKSKYEISFNHAVIVVDVVSRLSQDCHTMDDFRPTFHHVR